MANDLQARIRRALAEADGFDIDSLEPHDYQCHTDAILAIVNPVALLRWAAQELASTPHHGATALTGPYWHGQGWDDAVWHLHFIADHYEPTPTAEEKTVTAQLLQQRALGDAAWGSAWLHGKWSWLTKNMTTPEREHAADCVARWSAALNAQDAGLEPGEPEGLRWWRNSPSRDETHNTDPNEES